jgi:L-alanine-DL-glutamate epimerase-like enolase superfamily enzyme
MKARVIEAQVAFVNQPFAVPLHISTGSIHEATEARVTVRARVDGREAVGRGSIYLSDLWAWPDPNRSHSERDAAMRRLCECLAADLDGHCGAEDAHPLELGLRLDHAAHAMSFDPDPPALARANCACAFDAAIHDAAGLALGVPAFDLYDEPCAIGSADRFFPSGGAVASIRRLLRRPYLCSDAWFVVSPEDAFEDQVRPWVHGRGYRCFKLKLLGRDNAVDAAHTARVFRAVSEMGARSPRLMADTNCANPDAASVGDYLDRVRALDPAAFAALEYVEQPTARDIVAHPHDWRDVTRRKPVFLDEGLTDLRLMEVALEQGWSGFALKTCKGHSFSLVAAAWARDRRLGLTLQDLTNPGLSAIHGLLFAAHVPTLNGVELNSPQFTPAANAEWLPRLAGLFEPTDGRHRLHGPTPPGLGSQL